MKAKLIVALAGLGLLGIGSEEEPGWLAQALASTDSDVDAAIVAYDGEDYEEATERLDAAVARRGERAELYYDRGLILVATGDLDGARELFQNGTLSEDPQVRASSHYQLGNLGLAQEDWDSAIDEFEKCLRILPDHQNAKWNLELALLRKQEQEEREKQEQEEQEQQDQGEQDQGEQGEDQQEQDQGEQGEDQQEQDQGEQGEDQQQQDQGEQGEDQQQQDQGEQGEQDQQQDQQQGQQDQPQPQPGDEQQAQAIESGELDAALDELDRQDAFMFGRPRGSGRKVEKDW